MSMTDRTSLAIGRRSLVVPRIVKRTLQVASAVIMTAAVALLVIVLNNVLTGRGGLAQGITSWTQFMQRTDILATIVLTAIVSVATLHWQRRADKR
jgi:hypothetical protein